MTRNLFIIAGASLVLSLACIAGAMALGGRDLAANDWTWVITDDNAGPRDNIRVRRGDLGPDIARTLEWTGGQTLTVDISADVTFVQGDKPGVEVRGPKAAVDRVRLIDGRLTLADRDDHAERVFVRWGRDGIHGWSESERLKIIVTAPAVDRFRIAGSGDLTIEGYDRPTMSVLIDGSGDIRANGKAASLELRTNGSGDAELEGLEVADATIDSTGSGETSVGPTGVVKIDLSGSGDVRLTRRAKEVQQNISGSGEVEGA